MYCTPNILTIVIKENNSKVCQYASYKYLITIYSKLSKFNL